MLRYEKEWIPVLEIPNLVGTITMILIIILALESRALDLVPKKRFRCFGSDIVRVMILIFNFKSSLYFLCPIS